MGFKAKAQMSHPEKDISAKLIDERRRPRRPCSGEVLLLRDAHPFSEIRGTLRDISEEGFRVAHHCAELSAGQQVRFTHPFAQGVATLMWSRVVGENVESGFLVSDVEAKE